jgi:hypothetical protein
MHSKCHLTDWIETLPAQGRHTFVRHEAEAALGGSFVATQSALRRLKRKGSLVSPRRGFYVLVPPEHRAAGAPPASWFVDDLMRYCGCDYYVGLLSAAAIHGAAHQQPMVFQVLTNGAHGTLAAGRVTIQAVRSCSVGRLPAMRVQTETGTMAVSTPEATAFDLVRLPAAAGWWNNIATVLVELAEQLDGERLLELAGLVHLPDVQRLGALLELLGHEHLAVPLAEWVAERRTTVVGLRSDVSRVGCATNRRWGVVLNDDVEPDQ